MVALVCRNNKSTRYAAPLQSLKHQFQLYLVPSLLAVIAGSAIFTSNYSLLLGIGALVAALLTAIHKGLDCDTHQAECRRLVQAYRGLETRYSTIAETCVEDAQERTIELEEKLAVLKESQLATVSPQWLRDRSSEESNK